ncbi:class I histocompatibility antigen, F10 alpha chain-like, partial [Python bivittatus]|uniref:Class I histocompatibility antigen, F10 alpha chain-like n=1 Tax=Python bivittatus TaxID=176946 RepID=A0A9F5J9B1_PYTBI
SSSHSLKYFLTSMSDPTQGLPHLVAVGYVDDQVFVYYDSNSRMLQPRVSWMEKVGKEDPQFWDAQTQIARGTEEVFRARLETLRTLYNLSEGLHTWQCMYGCEPRGDRSKGGFLLYGYNGRTFIMFDKETLTWVVSEPQAQITKRKWDADSGRNQGLKVYLEQICIEWLEKFLSYGKETLLRTGMETHVCRVDGFYPKEIDASWRRDGEVWLQDNFHGSVAPNADGTYHYWLSLRIDPQERDRYQCHVEHDGLQEPVDVAVKVPESNQGLIIGCVVAVVAVVVLVIVVILGYRKKRLEGYEETSRSVKII